MLTLVSRFWCSQLTHPLPSFSLVCHATILIASALVQGFLQICSKNPIKFFFFCRFYSTNDCYFVNYNNFLDQLHLKKKTKTKKIKALKFYCRVNRNKIYQLIIDVYECLCKNYVPLFFRL